MAHFSARPSAPAPAALLSMVEDQWSRGDGAGGARRAKTAEEEVQAVGRKYDSMVKDGKLREAVRFATERDAGRPYRLHDRCSKTGAKVLDVLKAKHPEPVIPAADDFPHYEPDEEGPEEGPDTLGIWASEEE